MSKNKIILLASGLIFSLSIIYIGSVFADLPQNIPVHFNIMGEPNQFAHKNNLFLFLGIYVLISAFILISYRNNALTNLPKRIKDNPLKIKNLIIDIHFIITILFSYIGLQSVRIAQGHISGLGIGVILLLALFIIRIIAIYREVKKS